MLTFVDEQGFGAASLAALYVFDSMNRATGRTSRLIERVKDGDQIVCLPAEAARLRNLLRDAKKDVTVIGLALGEHPLSRVGTAPKGRTFIEHTWVMQYHARAIARATSDLNHLCRSMSKTWPEDPVMHNERARSMLREWVRE